MAVNQKTCPMCTQAAAFNSSLNGQLSSSIVITSRDDKHYLNVFVSTKKTKEEKALNVGGTAYSINFCPWCGRDLSKKNED